MVKFTLCVLLISVSLLISTLDAAKFVASVDRNPIGENQSLTLTLQFSGKTQSSPNFKALENDFILMGTQQSQQTSMINGRVDQSITWTIQLLPRKTGQLAIPAIELDGEFTNPILISVERLDPQNNNTNAELFIDVELSSHSIYVGQEVLVSMNLRRKPNVKFKGLTTNLDHLELEQVGKPTEFQSVENGVRYINNELNYVFYPKQAGQIEIPTVIFSGDLIENSSQSFFRSRFMNAKTVSARSKPITLTVKPKPTSAPTPWLPTRQLRLTSSLPDAESLTTGEPVTWTVTLEALGLRDVDLPTFNLPDIPGIKIYADEPIAQTELAQKGTKATKTFKYAIVPSQAGDITLPELTIDWWNTETNQLETSRVAQQRLTIKPGANNTSIPASGLSSLPATQPLLTLPEPQIIRDTGPWKALTFFFAALWVITLSIWLFRGRKKLTTSSFEVHEKNAHKVRWADIRVAAQNNDAKSTQQALLDWANVHHRAQRISSLQDLANLVSDKSLEDALIALEQGLYRADTPWSGTLLLKHLGKLKHSSSPHQNLENRENVALNPT
ncbi:MAG: BatD family protein [Pseudomonadota bacterium]